MRRFLLPLLAGSIILTLLWIGLVWLIPPVHFLIVGIFLLLLGLILAGWISLGLYYLRRIWGQKDSPRVQLRNSASSGSDCYRGGHNLSHIAVAGRY